MRVNGVNKNENLTNVNVTVNVSNAPKSRIHNVFIIDASGSMSGHKYVNAIAGVNELLKSIVNDTDTDNNAMIVEFEGSRIKTRLNLLESIPAKYEGMGTGGMTPLNQAIGETLETVYRTRKNNYSENDKVLVNIFTDGDENSSRGRFADSSVLGKYIKQLENEGFTITFVGTKNEVAYAINTLSMDASNTLVHDNTAADISRSFNATVMSRQMYSKSVSKGEDVKKSFYTKTLSK
jgi:Mg-chelatase subunit ChlD